MESEMVVAESISLGVIRASDPYEPSIIGRADLPAAFPRLPDGEEDGYTSTAQAQGGWPTIRCDLIVLIAPFPQQTTEERYDNTLTIMDNVTTALRGSSLAKSRVRWQIRGDRVMVADNLYNAVVATIESDG